MKLFTKKHTSTIVSAGGPSPEDQLLSMAKGRYWTILNSSLLNRIGNDKILVSRANALKSALQTYGPESDKLPDLRNNKGKAMGSIFHGHVKNSNGTTYIIEWTVIDKEKRLLALIGFDTHENYSFRQKPLNNDEVEKISQSAASKLIIEYSATKIDEAKAKVKRVEYNYRNLQT